jgi:hypothetical protein
VVDQPDALTQMRDSVALWSVGYVTAAAVVDVACDLLVAGYDGPALCMLAAVTPRHADQDVPELLCTALRDVGLTHYERTAEPAMRQPCECWRPAL